MPKKQKAASAAPAPDSSDEPIVEAQGRLVPQPPDGSCLYHSLAEGARRRGVRDISAAGLRRSLASWTYENRDVVVNGQTIATWLEWEAGVAPKRYAQLQAKRGWGGALEIMGFANWQRFDVWVWVPCSGKRGRLYRRTACFEAPANECRGRIDVCRSAGVHYDYVELEGLSQVEQVEGSDDDDETADEGGAAAALPVERRPSKEPASGAPRRAQERQERRGKTSARAAREASLERRLAEMEVDEAERDGFEEEKQQIGKAVAAVMTESESVSECVRALMSLAREYQLQCDDLFGFIFLYWLDENAVEQITTHAVVLKKLFKASPDKDTTQKALLRYVQKLAVEGKHKGTLSRKVPRLLKAMYDLDLLEEEAVTRWYNKGSKAEAGRAVREAAVPFLKWLREAEEESEDETPVGGDS